MILEDYATVEALAEEVNRSPRTLERWVRQRIIPAPVKIGAVRMFHVPTLRKHLVRLAEKGAA